MALMALSVSLSGCNRKLQVSEIQDEPLIQKLNSCSRHMYPDNFKAVHHVVLTLFGKNYALNGYLKVNRAEKELHLIAQNDLGGTLFEVHTHKGTSSILSKTAFLKTPWLEKSVLKDLEILYLYEPFVSPRISMGPGSTIVLSEHWQGITREYRYKKSGSEKMIYQLTGYRHLKNNKPVYTVAYDYDEDYGAGGSGSDEKNNGTCPSFITIENISLNYQLKISVQYFFSPQGNS